MSATYELFTRWRTAKGIPNERQGALALGTTAQTVANWKSGRNANADLIEKMAKDIGEHPGAWAALAMKEQSKGEAARAWARIAKQLGAAATIAALCVLPYTVNASQISNLAKAASDECILCHRKIRRWLRGLAGKVGGPAAWRLAYAA